MTNLIKQERVSDKFSLLPNAVKEHLELKEHSFDTQQLPVSCSNDGDRSYDNFHFVFRSMSCKSSKFKEFMKKHKALLPENPKIDHIQDHWDEIVQNDKTAYLVAD